MYLSNQDIFLRNDHILKGDAPGVRAALSHVQLLAAGRDPGRVGVHDKAGEGLAGGALRVRIRAGQHEVKAGNTSE